MGSPIVLDANPNPFDVAAGAVAAYMNQKKQNQQDAEDRAIAKQAAADTHTLAGDTHTANQDAHTAAVLAAQAQAYENELQKQLGPLRVQAAALANQGAQGNIKAAALQYKADQLKLQIDQKYLARMTAAGVTQAEAQATIARVGAAYAPQDAAAALQSTLAGTANTAANTNRTNALLPGEVTGQNLGNIVTGQNIVGNAQTLNQNAGGAQLPKPTNIENAEYKVRHTLWQNQNKGKLDDAAALSTEPMSPDDFRANVLNEIGQIQQALRAPDQLSGGGFGPGAKPQRLTGRDQAKQMVHEDIAQIRSDPRLSESQKRMAEQALRNALAGGTLAPGGSNAALPFSELKPPIRFR